MMQLPKSLILASASPRRANLLRQIGLPFQIKNAGISEQYNGREPVAFATEMAHKKATVVAKSVDNAIVLAADTIVLLDKQILGKPANENQAADMLAILSGRMHEVITGYTIYDRPTDRQITNYEITRVWFRDLDQDEIGTYIASGSPLDKAGSYGIQDDFGAVFVNRIDGCYYNVVGLPLAKVYQDLKQFIKRYSIQM